MGYMKSNKYCEYCGEVKEFKTVTKTAHNKEFKVIFSTTFCICCLTQITEEADITFKYEI